MTATNIDDLIDRDIIAKADERLATTAARLDGADADVSATQAALRSAQQASAQAVAGKGKPLDAALQVEEAARRARVASEVHAHAADAHRRSVEWSKRAHALAHSGVYVEGARRGVAACEKADAGRRMIEEADADHAASRELQRIAVAAGHPHMGESNNHPRRLGTAAEERAFWAANRVDLERGTVAWDPGEPE